MSSQGQGSRSLDARLGRPKGAAPQFGAFASPRLTVERDPCPPKPILTCRKCGKEYRLQKPFRNHVAVCRGKGGPA